MVYSDAEQAAEALQEFEQRWAGDALVKDKWFALQATKPGPDATLRVDRLLQNPAFSRSNPNRVRSVVGAFAMSNPTGFHANSGAGYRWLADRIIELNGINPQVASRMATAFNQLHRYDSHRQELMIKQLKRINAIADLSGDVAEIVNNALGQNQA